MALLLKALHWQKLFCLYIDKNEDRINNYLFSPQANSQSHGTTGNDLLINDITRINMIIHCFWTWYLLVKEQ